MSAYISHLFERSPLIRVRDVELRADDDLQRHLEKLARVVLNEMYQFVGLLDLNGKLLTVNRAALEGGGMTLASVRGEPFWEAHWWTVSTETQEQLQKAIARAASGEFVRYDVEVYGGAAGNETIVIDFSLIPVRDQSGKVVLLLPEGRNITEKKRAEAEIARKNQELERLLVRVRELDELKSQFFANVSHELRTPLALILGPTERLLEGEELTALQRRDLQVIRRNASTLLKHVNDLLDVAKLDAGKMELRYGETNLTSLIRLVAGHFDVLARERGITFLLDVPEQLMAQVDAAKLERVALNLLSNAFKFVPAGGRVKVSLRQKEGKVELAVEDNGPGVEPALREKIFERFRQADGGSTREFGGTGLGLAIVRDFLDLHGGTIRVDDAPGGGALFVAELPLVAPEGVSVDAEDTREPLGLPHPLSEAGLRSILEELSPPVPAPSLEPPGVAMDKTPRVVLAEDNAELRRFLTETLAKRFTVIATANGEEALSQVLEHPPDLVITDIMMPRMSGDQLVRELRTRSELDGLPILVLSAKADEALRIALLSEGAQDYVVKPFSGAELVARANNLVQMKRTRELLQADLSSRNQDIEALAREVTAKKRELSTALEGMRLARDEAERAVEVKSNFLAAVSHELRTPLTTIRLQTERLERDAEATERGPFQRKSLERLSGATQRLWELVSSLLEHARQESGLVELALEPVDVSALIADAVEELGPRAEKKGLTLHASGQGDGLFVSDPRLLRLVISNLIDNAIKYTDRGRVEVALELRAGAPLRLSVSDTGRGIPPEDRARIFKPFEQLEPTRHKHTPGVGLGLSLVKRMVERLGGTIALRSEADRGSTFTVTLPRIEEMLEAS